MKWRAYPAYRPSGVEWLGEIPEHWEVSILNKIGRFSASGIDKKDIEGEQPVRMVNYTNVYGNKIFEVRSSDDLMETTAPARKAEEHKILQGDMLFTPSSETTEEIGLSAVVMDDMGKTVYSYHLIRFRAKGILDLRFKKYICNHPFVWAQFSRASKGTTRQILTRDDFKNIVVSIPPLPEQNTIAAFLDRETARIDALIEKKQRQIGLLQEKRSALISHTVTKGLDPNAKMKDSGIEWLGQIPAHWEVKSIKRLGEIRYGLGEPPEYTDDGLPFIRATDISRGKIDLENVKKVKPEDVPWSRRPLLAHFEILVVRSGAYTGDSAIVTESIAGCIAGYDMVLTVKKAHAPFVAWVLLSKYMLQGQIYLERLRAAQPHLNAEELGGFVAMIPPLDEQRAIASFLDRETARIDALVGKVKESIDKLREYRTALISAAVTGKIDVRGEVA